MAGRIDRAAHARTHALARASNGAKWLAYSEYSQGYSEYSQGYSEYSQGCSEYTRLPARRTARSGWRTSRSLVQRTSHSKATKRPQRPEGADGTELSASVHGRALSSAGTQLNLACLGEMQFPGREIYLRRRDAISWRYGP